MFNKHTSFLVRLIMATISAHKDCDENRGFIGTCTGWIDVQRKTFTNWVNDKLKDTPYKVTVLEDDFSDGITLIKLLEKLAKRTMHKR